MQFTSTARSPSRCNVGVASRLMVLRDPCGFLRFRSANCLLLLAHHANIIYQVNTSSLIEMIFFLPRKLAVDVIYDKDWKPTCFRSSYFLNISHD